MEEFLGTYGPFILLALFLVYLIGMNLYRAKKYNKEAQLLLESLKIGDYVKTYAGFFGTVEKIEEKALENGAIEKMVTLKLGEASTIVIDANSIFMIVNDFKPKAPKPKPTKK
jgi:preprotein translocase YajC subunit